MKVYLAHNYAAKELLRPIKAALQAAGVQVTSRWIDNETKDGYDARTQKIESTEDVADVLRADAVVLFTDNYGDRPGRGKYVELGMAIGFDKRILLVGKDQTGCVFYHLPQVEHYPVETTTADLIKALLG